MDGPGSSQVVTHPFKPQSDRPWLCAVQVYYTNDWVYTGTGLVCNLAESAHRETTVTRDD